MSPLSDLLLSFIILLLFLQLFHLLHNSYGSSTLLCLTLELSSGPPEPPSRQTLSVRLTQAGLETRPCSG